MARAYQVEITGLENLARFADADERIATAARQALNKTIDHARAVAAREIRQQVAFPAAYLSPAQGRLTVSKRASNDSLEARVRGQQRPTSLARFLVGGRPLRTGGANVQVKPGHTVNLPRVFPIKLRGSAESQFNIGLAVRLKPGESLRNKREARRFAKNLYILYGPSVDQVFASVRNEIAPDLADYLEAEFLRLRALK